MDTQAITYASLNMAPSLHGNVLTTTDVQVGTWNFNSRTFLPRGSNPNAVYAVTRRSTENSNPLATNFLRISGLQSWDVIAEAVAEAGIDECLYNGIVAGGDFFLRPHITYTNLICLIGHEQFHFISNDTTFDPGVYVGAGCNESDKKCIGPGTNPEKDNTGFPMAFNLPEGNYNDPTLPSNAAYVGDFIDAARAMARDNYGNSFKTFIETYNGPAFIDFTGFNYLSEGYSYTEEPYTIQTGELPTYVNTDADDNPLAALPDSPEAYTLYDVTDCPQNGYTIPEGTYDHVGMIFDCPITFVSHGNYTFTNSLIASTFEPSGGGPPGDPDDIYEPAKSGKMSIHGAANIELGQANYANGIEMYSYGHIDFASSGNFANVRILGRGDVKFAASGASEVGTNIEALGDVDIRSGTSDGATWGLCPGAGVQGPVVLSYALVQ